MSLKQEYLKRIRHGAAELKSLDEARAEIRAQFLVDLVSARENKVTQQQMADETHFSRQRISQFLKETRDAA